MPGFFTLTPPMTIPTRRVAVHEASQADAVVICQFADRLVLARALKDLEKQERPCSSPARSLGSTDLQLSSFPLAKAHT